MEWDQLLSKYAGQPIKLWIEDRSGEEQTKPKPYSLFKVALADDRKGLQFYLNAAQFLSIPIFDESLTKLEKSASANILFLMT
ncbi:MAG: hypothetical protein K0Q73_8226 [Paenibacillus sp.]|jgi:hypothetical protein|nr:hypothetical protein [Paenibacillus sp.]